MRPVVLQVSLLLLILPALSQAATKVVSVHVVGQLYCNGTPYNNEKLEIYEKDYVLRDSWAAATRTDENGFFELKASVRDLVYRPEPYLFLVNWCQVDRWEISEEQGKIICSPALKVYIPDEYTTDGYVANKTLDLKRIDLLHMESQYKGIEIFMRTNLGQYGGDCRAIDRNRDNDW